MIRARPAAAALALLALQAAFLAPGTLLAQGPPADLPFGNTPADMVPFRRSVPYERFFVEPQPFLGPGREETPVVPSLRIGVLAPSPAGIDGPRGTMMRHGIDLAVEEANASRGAGDLPFETVVREDAPLWGSAANIMVDLAYRDAVLAVVGTIDSNATHVALRVGLKAELMLVNTGSSDPTVTETNIPWILRSWPDDRQHGYRLAQIVVKERGLKRIVVFRANDRYARMGIKIFADSVRRLGVPLVQEMRFLPGDRAFDTQVQRLKAAAPDAVVFWGEPADVGRAAAALRAGGVTVPFFGPDRLLDPAFVREAGPAAEGTTITVPLLPGRTDAAWTSFESRFRERWKVAPDAYAVYAYDGTRILLEGIRKAGPNRFRLRDALYAVKSWEGVAGTLRFDATGTNVAPLHVVRVKRGAFVPETEPGQRARPAALPSAAQSPAPAAGEGALVVGLLLPPDEPEARSVRRGAEAAIAEAAAGGAALRLAIRGRQGPWGSDASEAARLLEDDGAAAIVAPPGGAASHLALQVAGRTGIPVASLCPDGSVTRTALPWMVRVAPSTSDELRALLGASPAARWLAFVPAGRPGREAARDLGESGKGRLVRVVEAEATPVPERLRGLLSEVRPDGILLWLDAVPAARLAAFLRGAGFRGTLAGPMRLAAPSFASAAGSAADGLVVPVPPTSAGAAEFARRYRLLHGVDPDPAAALAHDATALLAGLLRLPGDGARRAFPLETPVPGVTGPLRFDRAGNRIVSLETRRWLGGRLVGL